MTYLLILIPLFIVLAALVVFASMRRRDTEPRHRRSCPARRASATRARCRRWSARPTSGREVEKSAALERRPPEIEQRRRRPS